MKSVLLIRHAKSDQSFFGSDFERPLNDRGRHDAPMMAKRLFEKKITIDAFVSSPAKRAKKTAEIFAREYGVANDSIIFIPSLYHAAASVFSEVIGQFPNDANCIALFSHNPGITYFVNELVEDVRIDNMPTCGIFAVQANVTEWSDFADAKKGLLFFDYPKNS